ncbi:MAG: hypothetical protein E7101_02640 [Prevotella ruminicola]|uniref:Mobilization protein n=1 Tax=Xylanibacter ruminicola TaxID=839 RepID=A0A9D5P0P6_XYLRU|nr:hypothetical protein [Xylanibacter ruminicola]
MATIAKASEHIKPCNIAQCERHNRRDPDYIASLNPARLYIRTDLTHNNECYIAPCMESRTLPQHYDFLKALVKERTGRAMQEKDVEYKDKNGKIRVRKGSSPIREGVVNIKPDTTIDDLLHYVNRVHEKWGITAIQIHMHRDEGHYENPEDKSTWQPNLHAHIIWDWIDHSTGKSFKLNADDMSQIQDMVAETLEMERGKRKAETGAAHLERNEYILKVQEEKKEKLQKEIDAEEAKAAKMAQASLFDKMFNAGLSPSVRKAFEEKDAAHKEELRQATTAVNEEGLPYMWTSGSKKGQNLTWEELAKCREREKKDAAIKAEADKQAAVTRAKADAKAEHDVEMAKTRAEYELRIKKERLAVKDDGTPLCWKGGNRNGQQLTKDEAIKWLGGQLKVSQTVNSALLDRLRVLRDLLFATCSMNFKRVVEIIADQWKAGMKHFAKGMKDFIWSAISVEKTEAGRKSYVDDAVHFAKILAKTDPDLELDDKALKPLYDDALKIADGTWESYHQKRDQLFDAAVIALVEMGNCQNQRHLNQKQANIIEAFLAFDGGDRTQLCEEIWNVSSPKVNYYWRDGTFDALEELRTKELNHRTYGYGRGL